MRRRGAGEEGAGRAAPGRRLSLVVVVAALLGLLGCGGQESRETAAPPPSREPAAPAERPQPRVGNQPTVSPPPQFKTGSSTRGSRGNLVRADPKDFGDAVPVRYLPEGFVLPSPAKAQEGTGKPKPTRGIFDLLVDASLDDLQKFLKREYRDEGWKVINDQTIEVNGVKGFNTLFGRDSNQKSAGFRAQESDDGIFVSVQYSDISKY